MNRMFQWLFLALLVFTAAAPAQNTRYFLRIDPTGTAAGVLLVKPGDVITFTARAYEATANGNTVEIPIATITWSVDPASFGSITPQGVLTVAAANSTSVRGTVTATATISSGTTAGLTLTGSVAVAIDTRPSADYTISGTVTSATGPVAGATVSVMGAANLPFMVDGKTDANGDYSIKVPAGTYIVRASASGFHTEYYDNAASATLATRIVTDPAVLHYDHIDFTLDPRTPDPVYTISGTVRDGNGTPIAGAVLIAEGLNTPNMRWYTARSANDGTYRIEVPLGVYLVRATMQGYLPEYYNDVADAALATPVRLDASTPAATGIDFSLASYGGSIAGDVKDMNGAPLADVVMSAWINGRPSTNAAGALFSSVRTDANGHYQFNALAPGDYVVRASAQGFISEYYDNTPDIGGATAVTVAAQPVTGIDFVLDAGGSITGTVISADDNSPIVHATVIVRSRTLRFERGTRTDANGHYVIDGLPSGDYTVFSSAYKFIGKYYGSASSTNLPGVVQVTAPTAVTGIDFALTPAPIAPRRYRGTVVSRSGAVMLYSVVEAIRPSDGLVLATATDPQGNFEFGAWDGAVIRARALGHVGLYAGNTRDWKASSWSGAQEGVTFLLDAVAENGLASFSGEVRDAGTGAALRDAWVYGFDAAGSIYFSVTGDDGGFRINNTPNGTLDMLVSQVGYDVQNAAGEVADAHGSGSISAQRSSVTTANDAPALPDAPVLFQNYPNPFNPTTMLTVVLPERMRVSLRVYDLLGRQVATLADRLLEAGTSRFSFDARSLPSGIYLCRLDAGGTVQTRRMVLTR